MTAQEFQKNCQERGLLLSEKQLQQFSTYAHELLEYNQKVNLTAITEIELVYEKHFFDSLLPSFEYQLTGKLADIGTGAGFPGLVLKIAYPELEVTLVESNGKRTTFLELMIEKLALKNISVQKERGEDFSRQHKEEYDICTARAVASLPVLLEISAQAIRKGGCYLAYRGAKGREEILEAEHAQKVLALEKPIVWEEGLAEAQRIFAVYHKNKETPTRYPRAFKDIRKKSL